MPGDPDRAVALKIVKPAVELPPLRVAKGNLVRGPGKTVPKALEEIQPLLDAQALDIDRSLCHGPSIPPVKGPRIRRVDGGHGEPINARGEPAREMAMISPETALVYTMVLVSAADGSMSDNEIARIGAIVRSLPAFGDYDHERLTKEAEACADALADDEGLEKVLDQIVTALPARLAETAYAFACDVAAADPHITQEEARMLEMLRHALSVDRLAAAAIERAARARHQTV